MMSTGDKTQEAASAQPEPAKETVENKPKSKPKGLQVDKYEVADDKVKFFVAKGFPKKKWVLAKEIPLKEIENSESTENRLGLTVNGAVEWFILKKDADTFSPLVEQLKAQPAEQAPPQNENPLAQVETELPLKEEMLQPMEVPKEQPAQEPTPPEKPLQLPEEQPVKLEPQLQPEPQQEPQILEEKEPSKLESPPASLKQEKKPEEKMKAQGKPKSIAVVKFEVSEGKIVLTASNGFPRKKPVVIREIPVLDVEKIEGEANKLSVTWRGTAESFYLEDKKGSFKTLVDQVNGTFEEQRRALEQQAAQVKEKNAMRRSELLTVINNSFYIVDQAFNLLIDLQDKRINWQQIESYAGGFGDKLDFKGQTLPSMSLNYTKIGPAVKAQIPKEASMEVFEILKATYGYFDSLKPEEDNKESQPNFQTAKTLIRGYYILNDLLLGRFVGDKDNARENSELEATMQSLAEANLKVDVEALKDNMNGDGEKQTIIDDSRAVFKESLKQL